ncbi:MAG: dihydropyrimidinase [Clostridia bacterium]|nr:dihydropyrimidinase [Clostridia bacterium]
MDLVIKNGTIITSTESYKADIGVKDGKIFMIAEDIDPKGTEVVDASGKLVLPGAIDCHTHLEMPFGGTVSADSYEAGTRAGACGGVTTVFDFVIQAKGEGLIDAAERRRKLCDPQACVDYAFHTAITDLTPEVLEEMKTSVEYGVSSFKVFMVYDFGVTDGVFYKVLEKSKEVGALIQVHAENKEIIDSRVEEYLSKGLTSPWYHYLSRPEFVEAEADVRAIHWAKNLNAPLYIVHLANAEGAKAVTQARDEGYPIFAETCPQYLYFTSEVYKREDARNFVCSPPMKGQESQDELWAAIKRGDISTVATDHCPFQSYEKDWGKDDFSKIPNGCMGVENLYPYMLSEANKGNISYNLAVELCATNVAKIFGCAPQKGFIAAGSDADIVIYDPNKSFTVSVDNMHSDIDHTIWEGVEMQGYPVMTFSRGKLVYKDGDFVGEKGYGEFVKCNPVFFDGPTL